MAKWTFTGASAPNPAPSSKAPDVATATATLTTGTTGGTSTIDSTNGNAAPSWQGGNFQKAYTLTNPPTASTPPYFELSVDSSKYTNVTIAVDDYASSNWNASNALYVWSSANGGAFTATSPASGTLLKQTWTTNQAFAAATTGLTTTQTFRIGAAGSTNNNSQLNLDNITITGCAVANPPTMTKGFSPNPVAVGGTSTLTFTITNPNANVPLSGIGFTDPLPLKNLQGTVAVANGSTAVTGTGTAFKTQLAAGSIISVGGAPWTVSSIASDTQLTLTANYTGVTASGLTASAGLTIYSAITASQCGGTVSGAIGGSAITLTGGAVAAGGSCTITATVLDSIAGPINNVTGAVSSTTSGTNNPANGNAKASLTAVLPPSISKQFSPKPVLAGGISTLTFTITNPNQNNALSGVAFSDPFPATMTVASPATYSTAGCGSPAFAPTNGATSVSFSGGTIAAGGICTVTVNVTATATGTNTSGTVSHIVNGATVNGNTTSDTLTISPAYPNVYLFKEVASSNTASTLWNQYLAVPINTGAVYYQFTVQNAGNVPLNNVSVTDSDLPSGLSMASCQWYYGYDYTDRIPANLIGAVPFTLAVANNTNNHDSATCVLGPYTPTSAGTVVNNAAATVQYYNGSVPCTDATVCTDTDSATYATTGLTIAKSASPNSFTQANDTITYTYTVTNTGAATLAAPIIVTDNKTGTITCQSSGYLAATKTATCTAAYTVTATDVSNKAVTNTASASSAAVGSAPGATSPTVSLTVPLALLPSLTVVKTVQTVSDPVNGTTGPRIIPGSVMQYTIQVVNSGTGAADNNTVAVTDVIPANTAVCVSSTCSNPPVAFSCSTTPPCGLTFAYGTAVTYSNQPGGGGPYAYTPVPDANGFDASVTGVRFNPTGSFNAASGGNNAAFSLLFKVKVK